MIIPGLTLLQTYFVAGFVLGAVITVSIAVLVVLIKD